ncbi:MAG TPA: DUF3107 domain-containing protein [Candidatus Lumbricidophila sp.]|nr:DUF3107 domain-containing protein [Candidatus Lumbricidophila sp.]
MDVRIGIQHSPRELNIETAATARDVEDLVAAAIAGTTAHLRLTDEKGSVFVVPSASIAYVEIGGEEARRIGFVA